MGVGTDVVSTAGVATRLERAPALATRLFTRTELAAYADRSDSLAARFAAKEAVLKALGSALADAGLTPPRWRYRDIEVASAPGTPPRLALHGEAATIAARLGVTRWHLSLSHDGGMAVAYVIAES